MDETRLERKEQFIRELAEFLAGNQASKSIWLQIERERPPVMDELTSPTWAQQWAKLREASPLRGWPSVISAEKTLREFLL